MTLINIDDIERKVKRLADQVSVVGELMDEVECDLELLRDQRKGAGGDKVLPVKPIIRQPPKSQDNLPIIYDLRISDAPKEQYEVSIDGHPPFFVTALLGKLLRMLAEDSGQTLEKRLVGFKQHQDIYRWLKNSELRDFRPGTVRNLINHLRNSLAEKGKLPRDLIEVKRGFGMRLRLQRPQADIDPDRAA
jgi:hypothetical protein